MLDTFLPKIRSFGRCNGIRDVADEWNSGVFRLRSDCQIRLTRKGIVYLQEVSPFLDQLGDYAMRFSLILSAPCSTASVCVAQDAYNVCSSTRVST